MQLIRRNDMAPRVKMTPMIDVVFLLITFFIYSLIVMVQIDVKKVRFTELDAGVRASPQAIKPVTLLVDRAGALSLDREPIALDALGARLKAMTAQQPAPQLFLVIEDALRAGAEASAPAEDAAAVVDRLPLYLKVDDIIRAAGIEQVVRVGRPKQIE